MNTRIIRLEPTETVTQHPILTLTPSRTVPIPLPTLNPDQAEQTILALMQGNGGCSIPCFWGIIPGVSDFDQTVGFLEHLGENVSRYGTDPINYDWYITFRDKMRIHLTFQEENDKVRNISVRINHLNSPVLEYSDWMGFRPDTILRTYGLPTRVVFSLSYPTEPTTSNTVGYDFSFIYSEQDMIIGYWEPRVVDRRFLHICPLIDPELYYVNYWLGEDFEDNDVHGVDVQDISTLSVFDFYTLILGNPDEACFDLDVEAYMTKLYR
jgi:extradiol dioxygenase family protein